MKNRQMHFSGSVDDFFRILIKYNKEIREQCNLSKVVFCLPEVEI